MKKTDEQMMAKREDFTSQIKSKKCKYIKHHSEEIMLKVGEKAHRHMKS